MTKTGGKNYSGLLRHALMKTLNDHKLTRALGILKKQACNIVMVVKHPKGWNVFMRGMI